MRLIVKCSWCGRIMGAKECPGSGKSTLPITHSICPACARKLEEETEEGFQAAQEDETSEADVDKATE